MSSINGEHALMVNTGHSITKSIHGQIKRRLFPLVSRDKESLVNRICYRKGLPLSSEADPQNSIGYRKLIPGVSQGRNSNVAFTRLSWQGFIIFLRI